MRAIPNTIPAIPAYLFFPNNAKPPTNTNNPTHIAPLGHKLIGITKSMRRGRAFISLSSYFRMFVVKNKPFR